MITKYKLFENIQQPEVGDYIICRENYADQILRMFLANNIGQVIKIFYNSSYTVRYEEENMTDDISDYFIFHDINSPYYTRAMKLREILFYSPNKEDCKMFISLNKYNL